MMFRFLLALVYFGLIANSTFSQCHERADKEPVIFAQPLSPSARDAMNNCPEWILGTYRLFQYDPSRGQLVLSDSFKELLHLLVELKTLATSDFHDLNELNMVLQKPQGEGGLLRKPGTERWHVIDQPLWIEKRAEIERLLSQLGFMHARSLSEPVAVQHCIIFAARAERMEARVRQTLDLLLTGCLRAEKIYLLGSKRPLIQEEREFLSLKIDALTNEKQQNHWKQVLLASEGAVEADALTFLWETLAPGTIQKEFEGKVFNIQSSRVGFSYNDSEGHRPTTEVTADNWLMYYAEGERQSIFALAEQPYGRLLDQLRSIVLTNAQQANIATLKQRTSHTDFYFVQPANPKKALIGVYLDEIARNVYRVAAALSYLDGISNGCLN